MFNGIKIECRRVVGETAAEFVPLLMWGKGVINPTMNLGNKVGIKHKHYLTVETAAGKVDAYPGQWIRCMNEQWDVLTDEQFHEKYKNWR